MYAGSIGCNPRPEFSTFLRYRSGDGRTFHFTFVVDNNSCVIFEVQEHSILPAEWLPLSDHYCWHYLLSEFWFSFLHRCYKHISSSCRWKSIETTFDTTNSNDIQVLCSTVVSTVDDSTNWKGQRHSEFASNP